MQYNATQQLEQAVERLYSVFAMYPLEPEIVGCDHCVFPEDHARLRSRPLRELTPDDLSKYAGKAMTTWGAESDYKHFLPRICELIAFADPGSGLHERTNWKLDMVRSQEWSEVEEQATRGYFVALWDYTLLKLPQDISDEPVSDIVDCLNSLVILGFDLPELLDLWLERAESSLAPALRIAELAISAHSLTVTTAQREQIASWLLGDRVRSLLDRLRVQSAEVNEEYADYISYSLAQLDKWRDERQQEGTPQER